MNVQSASVASANPSSPNSQGVSPNGGNGQSSDELKTDFLKLMVAQIKNQDPLNPMDGTQFVSQLAELTSVEGIQNMGTLQKQNNVQLDNLEVLQSAMLAGDRVTVPADRVELVNEEPLKGRVDVKSATSELLVVARDAAGNVVEKVNLGPQKGGSVSFDMNALEPGKYSIEAISMEGDTIINHATSLTRVVEKVSPNPNDGSIRLSINGIGEYSMFDVQEFHGE